MKIRNKKFIALTLLVFLFFTFSMLKTFTLNIEVEEREYTAVNDDKKDDDNDNKKENDDAEPSEVEMPPYQSWRNYEQDWCSNIKPNKIRITSEKTFNASVTIMWQTCNKETGDAVYYDTETHENILEFANVSVGFNFTYEEATGYLHVVQLNNLKNDTLYYFQCGGKVGGWSEIRAFRTAPTYPKDFSFCIAGDSQDISLGYEEPYEITRLMMEQNPDFVVHLGDIVDRGSIPNDWNFWFDHMHEDFINSGNLTVPIIPVVGNHEDLVRDHFQPRTGQWFNQSDNYINLFALPNNEQWYYQDWGNLRIIVLNSDANNSEILEQKEWLNEILEDTPEEMSKIACYHHHAYSSRIRAENWTKVQEWIPVFDKYHVNLAFNGHIHNYQRTKPMFNGTIVSDYSQGTMYIGTGGWGSHHGKYNERGYSANGFSDYHFVRVDVYANGTIGLTTISIEGHIVDSVKV